MECSIHRTKPFAPSTHPLPLLLRCSMHEQGNWSSEHLLEPERVSRVRPIRLRQRTVFSRPAARSPRQRCQHQPLGTQSTLPRILGSPVWGRIGARQGGGQHTVCNVASLDPLASRVCAGVIHTLPSESPLATVASHRSRLDSSSVLCPVNTSPFPIPNWRDPKNWCNINTSAAEAQLDGATRTAARFEASHHRTVASESRPRVRLVRPARVL